MTTPDQRSEAQIISPEKLESLAAQQRRCGYTLAGVCDALDNGAAELRRLAEENERLKAQAVPEGWKLVPVELLRQLRHYTDCYLSRFSQCGAPTEAEIDAMLNAAPQPAAPMEPGQEKGS